MDLLLLIVIVLAVVWQRKTSQRLARLEDELAALKTQLTAVPLAVPEAVKPLEAQAAAAVSDAATEVERLNGLRTPGDGVRYVARITRLERPA